MLIIVTLCFIAYCYFLFQNNRQASNAEHELLSLSRNLLNDQDFQSLKQKTIWVGMPKCLIRYSDFGNPEHVKEQVKQNIKSEIWYYQGREYRYRKEIRHKYDMEIYISNDFVTGWKQ